MLTKGILYGVGVGPGDPEDITLKAVKIIKLADILVLPESPRETCASYRIAEQAVPEIADRTCIALSIPMSYNRSEQEVAYDKAAQTLASYLQTGKKLAYLTIGDPSIYSSYTEIDKRIMEMGYKTQMICGVPSFCACAAALGVPLVKGKEELCLIPGNAVGESQEAITEVYMKSGRHMRKLKENLLDRVNQEALQVMTVSNCGYPSERISRSMQEFPETTGYMTTVIVKNHK